MSTGRCISLRAPSRTKTTTKPHKMTIRIARHAVRSLQCLIATGLLLFATAASAYQPPASTPDEADLSNHNTYRNSDGAMVHAPARSRSGKVPEGASVDAWL